LEDSGPDNYFILGSNNVNIHSHSHSHAHSHSHSHSHGNAHINNSQKSSNENVYYNAIGGRRKAMSSSSYYPRGVRRAMRMVFLTAYEFLKVILRVFKGNLSPRRRLFEPYF